MKPSLDAPLSAPVITCAAEVPLMFTLWGECGIWGFLLFFAGREIYTKMRVGRGCDRLLPSSAWGAHSLLDSPHRSEETVRFDEVSKTRYLVGESFVANVLRTQTQVLTSETRLQVNLNGDSIFSSLKTLEKYADSYVNICRINPIYITASTSVKYFYAHGQLWCFEEFYCGSKIKKNNNINYLFNYMYKKSIVLETLLKSSMLSKKNVECKLIYHFPWCTCMYEKLWFVIPSCNE